MALVTSIRKNKEFQMEGKQIIGKQEKGVHFHVICDKFYFEEAQQGVLGQYTEEGA